MILAGSTSTSDFGPAAAPVTFRQTLPKSARSAKVEYSSLPPDIELWLRETAPPGQRALRKKQPPASKSKSEENEMVGLIGRLKKLSGLKPPTISRRLSFNSNATTQPQPPAVPAEPTCAPPPAPAPSGKIDAWTDRYALPRTLEEFQSLYAKGDIDLDNPPFPPMPISVSLFPSPNFPPKMPTFMVQNNFPAPPSPQESTRQRVLARLDLFGVQFDMSMTKLPSSDSPSTIHTPTLSSPSPRTSVAMSSELSASSCSTPPSSFLPFPSSASSHQLQVSMHNTPILESILCRCRDLFDTRIVVISVLNPTQQVFLASHGMPEGVHELPRTTAFCTHMVLNGENGMVVLDTQRDWRFKNNVLTVVLGARFYAGAPVFASCDSGSSEKEDKVAIGSLCIIDDHARDTFSEEERAQLRSLAAEVSSEIESFVLERECFTGVPSMPASTIPTRTNSLTRRPLPAEAPALPSRKASLDTTLEDRYRAWQAQLPPPRPPRRIPVSSTPNTALAPHVANPALPFHASEKFASRPLPFPSKASANPKARTHRRTRSVGSTSSVGSQFLPVPNRASIFPPTPPASTRRPSTTVDSEEETSSPRERSISPVPPSPLALSSSPSKSSPWMPAVSEETQSTTPESRSSSQGKAKEVEARRDPLELVSALARPLSPEEQALDLQMEFKSAVHSLGKRLRLSLVYLIVVDTRQPNSAPRLSLLASYNRAHKMPSFSPSMHLNALNAPEGGLYYRNPDAASLPPPPSSDDSSSDETPPPRRSRSSNETTGVAYSAGILLPVAKTTGRGIVLGGFTRNPRRDFSSEDMDAFAQIVDHVCLLLEQ
ncbi:hypothetical protein MNV49_007731 [Pseudohyphozyma bogoriensis]|nr:hypothetical protein MNV49_007731 [Pseudohyphozyma bogoriensis]